VSESDERQVRRYLDGLWRLEICRLTLGHRPIVTPLQFDAINAARSVGAAVAAYRRTLEVGEAHTKHVSVPSFGADGPVNGVVFDTDAVVLPVDPPGLVVVVAPSSGIVMIPGDGADVRIGPGLDARDPLTAALAVVTKHHHWPFPGKPLPSFLRPADPRVAARPRLEGLGLPASDVDRLFAGYKPDQQRWALEAMMVAVQTGDVDVLRSALGDARAEPAGCVDGRPVVESAWELVRAFLASLDLSHAPQVRLGSAMISGHLAQAPLLEQVPDE
jgi:hypothetical protein